MSKEKLAAADKARTALMVAVQGHTGNAEFTDYIEAELAGDFAVVLARMLKGAEKRAAKLADALRWSLEWIDAVPEGVALPAMPGFDRDYVSVLLDAQHAVEDAPNGAALTGAQILELAGVLGVSGSLMGMQNLADCIARGIDKTGLSALIAAQDGGAQPKVIDRADTGAAIDQRFDALRATGHGVYGALRNIVNSDRAALGEIRAICGIPRAASLGEGPVAWRQRCFGGSWNFCTEESARRVKGCEGFEVQGLYTHAGWELTAEHCRLIAQSVAYFEKQFGVHGCADELRALIGAQTPVEARTTVRAVGGRMVANVETPAGFAVECVREGLGITRIVVRALIGAQQPVSGGARFVMDGPQDSRPQTECRCKRLGDWNGFDHHALCDQAVPVDAGGALTGKCKWEYREQPTKAEENRRQLVELAQRCAAASDHAYTQVPDFVPHQWIVDAMAQAVEARAAAQRADIQKVIDSLEPDDWCGDESMMTVMNRVLKGGA